MLPPGGRASWSGRRGGRLGRAFSRPKPIANLLAFAMLFGVSFSSGFYVGLVPLALQPSVYQAALVLHIAAGAASLVAYAPFVLAHQRRQEGDPRALLQPWRAWRKREDESPAARVKRLNGHALHASIALVGATGLLLVVPSGLWAAGIIWLPGYAARRAASAGHLGTALLCAVLMLVHTRRRTQGTEE